ncbi:alpha/beta hydrolase [Breoghania sp.]|uniref:alpha/beta hydrolase n=1 Tax=Breoghania sp. TaxID=2065378 RepID=UPI002627CEB5|nr:alpha/beta hydrolase [Breoghania sp.]MDJ0932844.1 alpha/beta hydrolase [Breoghania sp.]
MSERDPQFLSVGEGSSQRQIAVRHVPGKAPGVIWLSGFKSDMLGSKAVEVACVAREAGHAVTRFDYSGHGESGGAFVDGTISRWLEETQAVFDTFCTQPTVIIGSSMGGWIALLLALSRKQTGNVAGLILVAPAPDFTEELLWKEFPEDVKHQIETTGRYERPSEYADEPYFYTRELIEDGRKNLVLGGSVDPGCPVRIFQGMQDTDVPWQHALELVSRLPLSDVTLTLIRDGDHRLSRPQDIEGRLLPALGDFGIGSISSGG